MSAFLDGFRKVTGLTAIEADEQWAAFSYQLSDAERRRIEAGGFAAGQREGKKFLDAYPNDELEAV